MGKIRFVSRIIQIIFALLFILTPVAYVLFWTSFGIEHVYSVFHWNIANIPEVMWVKLVTGDIPPYTRFVAFIISLIPIATFMFLYYYLFRLFGCYGHGDIFTSKTVRFIRNCGITLLLWQILNPLYQILMTYSLSVINGPGHRFIAVSLFGTPQARDLVTAIVIIVISWIMQRGSDLEDEVRLTV